MHINLPLGYTELGSYKMQETCHKLSRIDVVEYCLSMDKLISQGHLLVELKQVFLYE